MTPDSDSRDSQEVCEEPSGLRFRLFQIVEKAHGDDRISRVYDIAIVVVALVSLLPLTVKEVDWPPALYALDLVTVYILFFDYILRWITYDFKCGKTGWRAAVRYPFSVNAIIDLLAILPSLGLIPTSFKFLRVLRVVKIIRYSKSLTIISNVFKSEKDTLLAVLVIAIGYIVVSALAMFTYEPDSFNSFFHAMYWATTALTTVGYGDVYPTTDVGRFISMVSSLFGIAVIALPAGIVTGGFLDEIRKSSESPEEYYKDSRDTKISWRDPVQSPAAYFRTHPRNARYAAGMLACVVINALLYHASAALGLPLWMDTTGTALAAFSMGPQVGIVVAVLNNLYLAVVNGNASSLIYVSLSAIVALSYGCLLRRVHKGRKGNARNIIWAIVLITVGIAMLDILFAYWLSSGTTTDPEELALMGYCTSVLGMPDPLALFSAILGIRVLDDLAVALCVFVLWKIIPRSWKNLQDQPNAADLSASEK